jgi:GNAT superfamily N-acetyltransferase
MFMQIKIAELESEYAGVLQVIRAAGWSGVDREQLREADRAGASTGLSRRRVALDDSGSVIGFAHVVAGDFETKHRGWLTLLVDPNFRSQGAGSVLLEDALKTATNAGFAGLQANTANADIASLEFAQHHGFEVLYRAKNMVLNLADFDESRVAGLPGFLERLKAQGFRFFSEADAGNTDEAKRKRYDMQELAVRDSASRGVHYDYPTYQEWREGIRDQP